MDIKEVGCVAVDWIHLAQYKAAVLGRCLPLNAELNPICHLQALLGAHHILHVFRIGVKLRFFSKSQ